MMNTEMHGVSRFRCHGPEIVQARARFERWLYEARIRKRGDEARTASCR
jgi:hypothetical protein